MLCLNGAAPVFGMACICILVSHDELLHELNAMHSHGRSWQVLDQLVLQMSSFPIAHTATCHAVLEIKP